LDVSHVALCTVYRIAFILDEKKLNGIQPKIGSAKLFHPVPDYIPPLLVEGFKQIHGGKPLLSLAQHPLPEFPTETLVPLP